MTRRWDLCGEWGAPSRRSAPGALRHRARLHGSGGCGGRQPWAIPCPLNRDACYPGVVRVPCVRNPGGSAPSQPISAEEPPRPSAPASADEGAHHAHIRHHHPRPDLLLAGFHPLPRRGRRRLGSRPARDHRTQRLREDHPGPPHHRRPHPCRRRRLGSNPHPRDAPGSGGARRGAGGRGARCGRDPRRPRGRHRRERRPRPVRAHRRGLGHRGAHRERPGPRRTARAGPAPAHRRALRGPGRARRPGGDPPGPPEGADPG